MNPWKLDAVGQECLAAVDTIATNVIAPAAVENDRQGRYPEAALKAFADAGLLGMVSAKEVGGKGQGLRAAMAAAERVAREDPSAAMVTIMHFCGAAVLEAHGNEQMRRQVAEGKCVTTLAFSESGSRSHFWLPVSTATREGDQVRLDAVKQMITSAGKADLYVWSSKSSNGEGLSSIWAVPGDSAGLSIPAPFDGMGMRSNNSAPITASELRIPAANVLGEDGAGFDLMMGTVMPWFSFQNASVSLGCMEGSLAACVGHLTRSAYAYDGSTLRDIPQVRGYVARMKVRIDMVRSLLLDGIDAVENGREDATLRVLQAKVAAAEASLEVNDMAMRVCGGAAFRKDVGVERYFRDSRAASVMAPVSDALYDFIGKAVCGMDVF